MTPGTLNPGEIHPAAQDAMAYIRSVPTNGLFNLVEVFASVALSGNRNAEICGETLQRILNGEPVSIARLRRFERLPEINALKMLAGMPSSVQVQRDSGSIIAGGSAGTTGST